MNLTRFGFNLLTAIYLVPLVILDIVGNTVNGAETGTATMSDFYFFKTFVDGALLAYALVMMYAGGATTSSTHAEVMKKTFLEGEDVAGLARLPAYEYIYCACLSLYCAANAYFLHALNKEVTGLVSVGTLVWSILSVVIFGLSALQFWRIKSGKIVELSHKIIQ